MTASAKEHQGALRSIENYTVSVGGRREHVAVWAFKSMIRLASKPSRTVWRDKEGNEVEPTETQLRMEQLAIQRDALRMNGLKLIMDRSVGKSKASLTISMGGNDRLLKRLDELVKSPIVAEISAMARIKEVENAAESGRNATGQPGGAPPQLARGHMDLPEDGRASVDDDAGQQPPEADPGSPLSG